MPLQADNAARWMYRGLWAGLVRWFRVPADPPVLPARPGEAIQSFQPSPGFLRYLKFLFWILLWPMDIGILAAMIAIFATLPILGLILLIPAIILAVLPDILAYIALHLRYDSTWYVMTDRSLRIRRGIWVIKEVTITFENVQNIRLQAGPVQRHFGIASLIVETAGGSAGPHGEMSGHTGVIEGIDNAPELRDRIMKRLRHSATAGLGDEAHDHRGSAAAAPAWTQEHVQALREIRDEIAAMPASPR